MSSRIVFLFTISFLICGCGNQVATNSEAGGQLNPQTESESQSKPEDSSEKKDTANQSEQSTTEEKPNTTTDPDLVEMTAVEWNRLREERKYDLSHLNGKRIQLSGIVGDVDLDYDDAKIPTVKFQTANGFWYGVMCYVPGPTLWETVKPGQQLTLEYKHTADSAIYPHDCKIVSVTGEPTKTVDAQTFVDDYKKDEASVDEKYIFESKARRFGLEGKVREVVKTDRGSVIIVFETQSEIPVIADMSEGAVKHITLPTPGDTFRAWGSYSKYTAPKDGESVNLAIHSLGVLAAVPFPAD